jgi:hypothetical protein
VGGGVDEAKKNILLFRSVQVLDHGIASYIQFDTWVVLLAILVHWLWN